MAAKMITPTGSVRCVGIPSTFHLWHGQYRLRTLAAEMARALLIVMRQGSLSAAEEITGHKYEIIGRWPPAAQ